MKNPQSKRKQISPPVVLGRNKTGKVNKKGCPEGQPKVIRHVT